MKKKNPFNLSNASFSGPRPVYGGTVLPGNVFRPPVGFSLKNVKPFDPSLPLRSRSWSDRGAGGRPRRALPEWPSLLPPPGPGSCPASLW